MTTPLISIVTATYDMGHFLGQAIESIQRQSYDNYQHIIIDDGSNDDTREVVAEHSSDLRIEYHYQENAGQTVAKNHGVRRARGDFVCFLDADNLWLPDKLRHQVDLFADLPQERAIVFSDQTYIDGEGATLPTPKLRAHSGRISGPLLFENFVTFNTVMVRKECFDRLGGFDETLTRSIDYELWLRFSTKYEFEYQPEVTTLYRVWAGQMSQDRDARFHYGLIIMRDFIERHRDLVDDKTVRGAWAYAFMIRGRYKSDRRQYADATKCFLRALRFAPLNPGTWKSIARMLVGPRASDMVSSGS